MTSIKRFTGGIAALLAALAIGALPMTAQAMGPPGPEDTKVNSQGALGTSGAAVTTHQGEDRDKLIDNLP